MATTKKTGREKFITYVNSRIGQRLSTTGISRGTKTHLRSVQRFCKAVRGTRKVTCIRNEQRELVYTFKTPITSSDLQ